MKLFDGIELTDLALYVNQTLVMTDFHMGYEEELNKKGVLVPRTQFKLTIQRLEKLFMKLKGKEIKTIVINGDLKHEFGSISDQEWRHTLQLIDFLAKHCDEIILIKGNHDKILGPIADKKKVKLVDYHVIPQNKILCLHGDSIPEKEILKDVSTIIIGHEHPAISIKDSVRSEAYKAFLVGKWKGKNLIALPSFNLVTEGTDVLKEKLLSPFLKDVKNFKAIIVSDKLYDFGKVKDL